MQDRKISVNLNDSKDLECEKCQNIYFEPIFRIKKLSALFSASGKETMVPVQLMRCTNCGEILDDLE